MEDPDPIEILHRPTCSLSTTRVSNSKGLDRTSLLKGYRICRIRAKKHCQEFERKAVDRYLQTKTPALVRGRLFVLNSKRPLAVDRLFAEMFDQHVIHDSAVFVPL